MLQVYLEWTLEKSLRKCNNENRNHLLLFVLLSRSSKRKWPDALLALYSKEEKLLDPVEEGYVTDIKNSVAYGWVSYFIWSV